jgi:hypothetical protein
MKTRIAILGTAICIVPSLAASVASAQDTNAGDPNTRSAALPAVAAQSPSGRFGLKTQLAISSDAGLSISHTSVSGTDLSGDAKVTTIAGRLTIGGWI